MSGQGSLQANLGSAVGMSGAASAVGDARDNLGGEDRAERRRGGSAAGQARAWESRQGPARGTALPRESARRGGREAERQARAAPQRILR